MSIPTMTATSEPASPAPEERRSPARWGTAALALAVVVGLLLGYAGGMLTPGSPGRATPRRRRASPGTC